MKSGAVFTAIGCLCLAGAGAVAFFYHSVDSEPIPVNPAVAQWAAAQAIEWEKAEQEKIQQQEKEFAVLQDGSEPVQWNESEETSAFEQLHETELELPAEEFTERESDSESNDTAIGCESSGMEQIQDVSVYQIQWGDTLSGISSEVGKSVDSIAKDNQIEDVNRIYAGSALEIRSSSN